MKKIILKVNGLGIKNVFQAYVMIYDTNNCLIFKGLTYDGCLSLYLKTDAIYKIYLKSGNDFMRKVIYIDNIHKDYVLSFQRSIFNKMFTFHLTDSFYKGLNIEKGEIILCLK